MSARAEKALALLADAEAIGPTRPVAHQQVIVLAAQVQATLAVAEALEGAAAASVWSPPPAAATREDYRLFVNEHHTVLMRLWSDGTVEVAIRKNPDEIWGPPIFLKEEES